MDARAKARRPRRGRPRGPLFRVRPPPWGPCHAPGRRGSRRPSPAGRGAGRFNPGPRSAVRKRRAGAALGRRHIAGRLIGPREPFRLLIKSRILSSEKLTANMPPTHSGRQRHTGGWWGGGPRGAVSADGASSELRAPRPLGPASGSSSAVASAPPGALSPGAEL